MLRSGLTTLFCFTLVFSAFSQLIVIPVPKGKPAPKQAKKTIRINNGRITGATTPLSLPFWDDFSTPGSPYYPDSSRWQFSESVSLNDGIGIKPPSLGVVSFDGLDSLGRPYDITNALAKGYGDNLVSKPIRLGDVPLADRDSVYFSFFYQWQGNGEPPDPGDQLEVDFKNNSGDSLQWINVATITNDGDSTIKADTFYVKVIAVTDTSFFHNQFQFRIRTFGRISGPWDNWNVDYVYLNAHRFSTDISFPDRTIYAPLTSMFSDYWSIPATHFFADTSAAAAIIVNPTFAVTNLRLDQGPGNGQPINHSSSAKIEEWTNNVLSGGKTMVLEDSVGIFPDLEAYQRRIVPLSKVPGVQDLDPGSDSIRITIKTNIRSGDNKSHPGDYQPKYIPMDFRVNDTTSVTYILADYYAYDDGSAEFGAGLNQPAAELAYLFVMKTPQPDTVVAVDIYFPNFGDESDQYIDLKILKDTSSVGLLHTETVAVQRSALNRFIRYKLSSAVAVKDSFLVGWRQSTAAVIAAGLDKSNDSGDRMYYNVNGYWEQNFDVRGSLMIRPVFGTGELLTGLAPEIKPLDVYPNPNAGTFYLSSKPDRLEIIDYTGRKIGFTQEEINERVKIELGGAAPGMYILKAYQQGKTITKKIMVQPQGQ